MVLSPSSFHTLSDGHQVYERIWTPSAEPIAHLVFLHGFSDRIDLYDTFFNTLLATYPIRIIGWDRRGWGKSVHKPSERGNTGPMAKQVDDLNEYLNHVVQTIPDLVNTPLFIMGHSMGGQEAAYYMLNSRDIPRDVRPNISGFILESPFIGLDAATQPSAFKVAVGRFASKLFPHLQISNPVKAEYLSPDKSVQRMYSDDSLCHNLGTLECFRDMLQREAELTDLGKRTEPAPTTIVPKLGCPVLWTHGTADKATDYEISKVLCERLESCGGNPEDKVFKAYEGWFHQLHNEPNGCKEQYAKDVGEWIVSIAVRLKN